jgi:hypothetical protein
MLNNNISAETTRDARYEKTESIANPSWTDPIQTQVPYNRVEGFGNFVSPCSVGGATTALTTTATKATNASNTTPATINRSKGIEPRKLPKINESGQNIKFNGSTKTYDRIEAMSEPERFSTRVFNASPDASSSVNNIQSRFDFDSLSEKAHLVDFVLNRVRTEIEQQGIASQNSFSFTDNPSPQLNLDSLFAKIRQEVLSAQQPAIVKDGMVPVEDLSKKMGLSDRHIRRMATDPSVKSEHRNDLLPVKRLYLREDDVIRYRETHPMGRPKKNSSK